MTISGWALMGVLLVGAATAVAAEWRDSDVAVITEGLDEGDVVTLTSLSTAASGSRVLATIDGVKPVRNAASGSTGSEAGSDR